MKYITAGHHNDDSGASYNGRQENKETIKARDLLLSFFEKEKIIMDNDWENNTQLQHRIKPADGSVLLDIHFNAGSPQASGTECLVNSRDFTDKASLSYKMASEIVATTADVLGIRNRGVKSEQDTRHKRLGILNLGAGISVLWEICFISSSEDMEKYDNRKDILLKKVAEILKKYDALK